MRSMGQCLGVDLHLAEKHEVIWDGIRNARIVQLHEGRCILFGGKCPKKCITWYRVVKHE